MAAAASLYSSGIAAFRATSFETAIDLFTKVRRHRRSACLRPLLYATLHSQAIALDASQAKFYDARASAFDKLGRLKDALVDVRQVVRLAPDSHKVRRERFHWSGKEC
jgi:hypothetical protein